MKKFLVRAYFKAGILIPFYTCCALCLLLSPSSDFQKVLELTFYSGLTGICSLTIFLNCFPRIAENYVYSVLSWCLLPVPFIIGVVFYKVDWIIFRDPKQGDSFISVLYLVVFFLHLIGLVIGFQSFRATVLLNRNNEEILNREAGSFKTGNTETDI